MTTAPPTTNSTTTAATTTAPAPTPPGTPERGRYSVLNGSSTECLLAHMGLQLNVSYFSRPQNKVRDGCMSERTHKKQHKKPISKTHLSLCFCQTIQSLVNLNPKLVNSSGSCEATTALLTLTQEQSIVINFTFTLVILSLLTKWAHLYFYTHVCFTCCHTSLLYTERLNQQVPPECNISVRQLA